MKPLESLKHAWNLFANEDVNRRRSPTGYGTGLSPTRPRYTRGKDRSVVTSVCNRMAIDIASIDIRHVKLDEDDRYVEDVDSYLNNCLTTEANIDQTHRSFILDVATSMMDEGCVAVVPIETTINPENTNSYDIVTMRTGKIIEWYPSMVKMLVYNELTGMKEELTLPKSKVAIIENPLYAIMNEPNSTMQRLIRKLSLLDMSDEESSYGNLNLIVQLPYVVKTEAKRAQAEERRKEVEQQLSNNRYGVAYIDGTEKVTQLNRSIENNLMGQIEFLTNQLYSQLGITQAILDGTADDKTMNNYYNRTIEPLLSAIVDEFHRKFLTKTARTQKQAIKYFRDPFKLIPVTEVAEMSDKLTRNEITSSNEIRQVIGMKPSKDPAADELRNKNLSQSKVDMMNKQSIPNMGDDEKEENNNE